jgi:hypothetical protein
MASTEREIPVEAISLLPRAPAWRPALGWRGDFCLAFAALAIPAVINLAIVLRAFRTYRHPEEMKTHPPNVNIENSPRVCWLYLAGAALGAAGFAGFLLIAYHFSQASVVSQDLRPVFHAVAMGLSGTGSPVFLSGCWAA